ncbi:MAG: glycosyltransferase family 9 protein [Thermodesulfobacteriota bacterium]
MPGEPQPSCDLAPADSSTGICGEARLFMAAFNQGEKQLPLTIIDQLVEKALSGPAPARDSALQALYQQIILPLCDDFSSRGVTAAAQVLARVTHLFRSHGAGAATHSYLERHRITNEGEMLARYHEISQPRAISEPQRIKKVIVLSRVTIGADVALISPIIQRLAAALPQAQLIVVGPAHLPQLFAHPQKTRFLIFPFDRYSRLAERLSFWPRLHDLLASEVADLSPEEYILLDPDSRLSQLGLLPLAPARSSYCLNSRQDQAGSPRLVDICNRWLDQLLPGSCRFANRIWLKPEQSATARSFFKQFKQKSFKIVINLGSGGDPGKELPPPFARQLAASLLAREKTIIFLDSGCGAREGEAGSKLRRQLRGSQPTGLLADLKQPPPWSDHGLLQIRADIGNLAALIAEADLFIGYDSCCQHLATASQTPAIICFAGAPNPRFSQRWQPLAREGLTTTIMIDDELRCQPEEIINQVAQQAELYRQGALTPQQA